MNGRKVIIIGAGPAGLAAGLQLAKEKVEVEIFEADRMVGGISKTLNYNGNYFDFGGHRFFSKFDEVNQLWSETLGDDFVLTPRLSRIYYKNKFFDYPLKPLNALSNMGLIDTISVMVSYVKSRIVPVKEENSFEDWVSNRFGRKLYSMFFKTYTEKVWGIPCNSIGADWAAQRIKGLSLYSAVCNALFKPKNNDIKTLIDQFMYPKYGPGMMYEKMGKIITALGGKIHKNCKVTRIERDGYTVKSIRYVDSENFESIAEATDFISSMPLTELVKVMTPSLDETIIKAADSLGYRSLINVDIIFDKEQIFPDNWIYVHSPEVKLGRVQNFKNWSQHMVSDSKKTALGLEYFCTEDDEFWCLPDEKIKEIALMEIEKVGLVEEKYAVDGYVVRVPKAYPVYFTGYEEHLNAIKSEITRFKNIQPVGRYGIYRYNNMDHSIMTGLYAARNILYNKTNDIWSINSEPDYHEINQKVTRKRFDVVLPEKS